MSAQSSPASFSNCRSIIARFTNQINYSSTRQLQPLFPLIIDEIFGLKGKPGLNLSELEYYSNPTEYDAVFKFLHPVGPFFRLCYRLISEVNVHYEYPIEDLPLGVQQEIKCQSSCPPYYRQKIGIREDSMEPAFLLLNPFEYYIYYFIVYLVLFDKVENRKQGFEATEVPQKSTLYLRLCEEYISVFLPIDNSPIQPPVRCPARINIGETRTLLARPSKILRIDLVSRLLDSHDLSDLCVEDIWRSYLVAHAAIEFWGSIPSERRPVTDFNYHSLPSGTNVCAYRYLLKHLHVFSNSTGITNSKMDEFKREAIPIFQSKIYKFIKGTMLQWPHDSSFSLMLETWLTFIQPWRYTLASLSTRLPEENLIGRKWDKFITDNFLFYTYIFQLVLKRFENLDLEIPKNTNMLIRILKVYTKTNLSIMVREIEQRYINESMCGRSKWCDSITNHISQLETPDFEYIPIFSNKYYQELETLLNNIYMSRMANLEEIENRSKSEPSFNWLHWLPFLKTTEEKNSHADDGDRLGTVLQLFSSFYLSSEVNFEIKCPEKVREWRESEKRNLSSRERTLMLARKATFHGDPDTLLIGSCEIGVAVKILYRLSTYINRKFGARIIEIYNKPGYLGKLARSILLPPQVVNVAIDESFEIRRKCAPRSLPPRLSLRFLAHQLIYIYFIIISLFCLLVGIPLKNVYFLITLAILVFTCLRPLFLS